MALIYMADRLGCRYCLALYNTVEAEHAPQRLARRLKKLRARLGDTGRKPKWMRWPTYERLLGELERVEEAYSAVTKPIRRRSLRVSAGAAQESSDSAE